ncbi:MAG TPA: class I adenylate-forming enzyme family protein [Candidatus Sulfomarinibacteraceae bacterium]|nr:class I adenylate-forming enzyme family protein [Candidatus Sulfomarinibacteraceae bacterium]
MAQLQQNVRDFPHRTFITDSRHSLTYEQTVRRVLAAAGRFRASGVQRAYFYAPDSASVIVGLLAADHIGASACVLNHLYNSADLHYVLQQIGPGHYFSSRPSGLDAGKAEDIAAILQEAHKTGAAPEPAQPSPGTAGNAAEDVIILSSGTTGMPKAARYTWSRLLNQVRHIDRDASRVWLLTYGLCHFAGMQMLLHVLANGHTLVLPPSRQFEEIVSTVRRHKVDAISGTPTFWRLFAGHLARDTEKVIPLKQITLGGEVCTAELLSRLRHLFPEAIITQVYATTELGSCFAVTDGRPGFPVEFLERQVGNVRLKIVDGELYCKAENRMLGYMGPETVEAESGWMPTGDLVEIQGDRVLFRGRKSESINVGGVKIWPAKVEETILQAKNVLAARVYGRPNPVTGQLVVADLEVAPGVPHHCLIKEVRALCGSQLSRYEQPREIKIVDRIDRQNGKIARRRI